jgi:hypothetical protein
MVDYAKLIEEEKERKDSAISLSELQKKKDVELPVLFRSVEIALGEELAQANEELKRRGAATITGPFRPFIGEERLELGFGSRNPLLPADVAKYHCSSWTFKDPCRIAGR